MSARFHVTLERIIDSRTDVRVWVESTGGIALIGTLSCSPEIAADFSTRLIGPTAEEERSACHALIVLAEGEGVANDMVAERKRSLAGDLAESIERVQSAKGKSI